MVLLLKAKFIVFVNSIEAQQVLTEMQIFSVNSRLVNIINDIANSYLKIEVKNPMFNFALTTRCKLDEKLLKVIRARSDHEKKKYSERSLF